MQQNEFQELKKFKGIVKEIESATFIVAESKFQKLLRFVASSKMFLALMEECLKGFNFEYEYTIAKTSKVVDGEKMSIFVLPKNPLTKVALVFSLLYFIDTKQLDFLKFCGEFFHGDDHYKSYQCFCETCLEPFSKDIEYLITGVEQMEEDISFTKKEVHDLAIEEVMNHLKKLDNILATTKKLSKTEKEEVSYLENAFISAMTSLKEESIRVSFLGMKNAIKSVPRTEEIVKDVEKILKTNDLV